MRKCFCKNILLETTVNSFIELKFGARENIVKEGPYRVFRVKPKRKIPHRISIRRDIQTLSRLFINIYGR